jgi:hypothetical protein
MESRIGTHPPASVTEPLQTLPDEIRAYGHLNDGEQIEEIFHAP